MLIAVVAILARGVLVFAPPTLSNDMYRYIWDGRVMSAGISPYAYPPGAPEVENLHPEGYWIWDHINRKSAITVYPPGAELFYAGVYKVDPDSVTWTKTALALVDLLNCLILFLILRRLNMSPLRTLIYAWAPLPIIEFGGSGHVEALSVFFTLLAILAGIIAVQRKETENAGKLGTATALASVALAGAVLVKLVPLLLLAAWTKRFGWKFVALCIGIVGVVYVGFVGAFNWHISPFLVTYIADEESNAPLYHLLGDVLAPAIGLPDAFVRLALYAALIAFALFLFSKKEHNPYDFIGKSFLLVGAYLLLTTSAHQWYATWLLLFVPLVLPPDGLSLFEGDGEEEGHLRHSKYGPAFAALAYTGLTFLGYALFALRLPTVPEPILALQLAAVVGLGILWPIAGGLSSGQKQRKRIRIHHRNAESAEII